MLNTRKIFITFVFLYLTIGYSFGQVNDTAKRKIATDTLNHISAADSSNGVLRPHDAAQYDSLMLKLANGDQSGRWPVRKAPRSLPGAIFPYYRVVAYYGNMYSKNMGVLGQYPPKIMLEKLDKLIEEMRDLRIYILLFLRLACLIYTLFYKQFLRLAKPNVQTYRRQTPLRLSLPNVINFYIFINKSWEHHAPQ